ncbi:MAG: glutaredoxin family protein [Rudaea sp.]
MILTLYQRDNCHLCDLALDVLARARAPEFSSIFIDHDNEMEARYGERVPVLREELSRTELNWPFDAEAVADFLYAAATSASMSGVRQPHFSPQK